MWLHNIGFGDQSHHEAARECHYTNVWRHIQQTESHCSLRAASTLWRRYLEGKRGTPSPSVTQYERLNRAAELFESVCRVPYIWWSTGRDFCENRPTYSRQWTCSHTSHIYWLNLLTCSTGDLHVMPLSSCVMKADAVKAILYLRRKRNLLVIHTFSHLMS